MNIAKFSWAEMCNNSKGKTSGTLFAGLVILLSSSFTFVWSSIAIGLMLIFKFDKDINVINFFTMLILQSIVFAGVGGSLLGIHRLSKDKPVEQDTTSSSNTSTNTTTTIETKKTEETSV